VRNSDLEAATWAAEKNLQISVFTLRVVCVLMPSYGEKCRLSAWTNFFNTEVGGNRLLRNVGVNVKSYTMSKSGRMPSEDQRRESLRS
jgi:hypothetical protein